MFLRGKFSYKLSLEGSQRIGSVFIHVSPSYSMLVVSAKNQVEDMIHIYKYSKNNNIEKSRNADSRGQTVTYTKGQKRRIILKDRRALVKIIIEFNTIDTCIDILPAQTVVHCWRRHGNWTDSMWSLPL